MADLDWTFLDSPPMPVAQVTNMSYDKHVTMAFGMPPAVRGPAPTLTTINEIEVIIRSATAKAETPISLAEIKRRMKAKAVRHRSVRVCVDYLKRWGAVSEDPNGRGVEWSLVTDATFWNQGWVRVR